MRLDFGPSVRGAGFVLIRLSGDKSISLILIFRERSSDSSTEDFGQSRMAYTCIPRIHPNVSSFGCILQRHWLPGAIRPWTNIYYWLIEFRIHKVQELLKQIRDLKNELSRQKGRLSCCSSMKAYALMWRESQSQAKKLEMLEIKNIVLVTMIKNPKSDKIDGKTYERGELRT